MSPAQILLGPARSTCLSSRLGAIGRSWLLSVVTLKRRLCCWAGGHSARRLNQRPAMLVDAFQQAIASIERYFREYMDEKIGNVSAGALLGFFLEEGGLCL